LSCFQQVGLRLFQLGHPGLELLSALDAFVAGAVALASQVRQVLLQLARKLGFILAERVFYFFKYCHLLP